MTKPKQIPGYIEIDAKVRFFQDPSNPERIRLIIDHPLFTDAKGEKPGLHAVHGANPRSADFHPNNFNRCYVPLADKAGIPVERVSEPSRQLRFRKKLIAEYEDELD